MQKASYKPTNIEIAVQKDLDEAGISFVIHPWIRVFKDGVRRILRPDLLLPANNLIVEVQGCYWHGCTDCYGDKARTDRIDDDQVRIALFSEQGYSVLMLWEHDIKSGLTMNIIQNAMDQVLEVRPALKLRVNLNYG